MTKINKTYDNDSWVGSLKSSSATPKATCAANFNINSTQSKNGGTAYFYFFLVAVVLTVTVAVPVPIFIDLAILPNLLFITSKENMNQRLNS